MNIFVGNLPYSLTDEELKEAFDPYGNVDTARVVTDPYSGRSRGFGFVEMNDEREGEAAIQGLNGKDLKGRALTVDRARPKEQRRPRW